MKEPEQSLDPQLWHACAGGLVQIPAVNSKVYYFPQGHAEHACSTVDFAGSSRIPPLILCRVAAVKFLADHETDEVYVNIKLVPLSSNELDVVDDELFAPSSNKSENFEKPASFAKTLTQSDANNGGGFSVPRYCAETIFPKLDYSADPPVQTVVAKDVHGGTWKFRHIYRGTPRRHLLTTGWSSFVNQKKLVAGDSIVFLRAENGDLCVGIRRAKRGFGIGGGGGGGSDSPYGGGTFSMFLRELDHSKFMRNGAYPNSDYNGGGAGSRGKGKVRPESVIEAAALAAIGQPFEVVYYPRAGTPEFCIKTSSVRAAMGIRWCSGMRFKMPFETEDSSRISWFMGTISTVQAADPIRWPNSPWRLLQVNWDEPDLLHNVKQVNPWLVELVSNIPAIHMSPLSPPRKRLRLPHNPDILFDSQFTIPSSSGNFLGASSPLCCISDNAPAGIQGARHAQFGSSLTDLQLHNKLQSRQFATGPDWFNLRPKICNSTVKGNEHSNESLSCLLTMGSCTPKSEKSDSVKKGFQLFGQTILTEEHITDTTSSEEVLQVPLGKASSDLSSENAKVPNKWRFPDFSRQQGCQAATKFSLDTGHCKVFMESEDVGRTLDLSVISSYDELYRKLASMFVIERPEFLGHVLYHDATGAVKRAGDEPFSEFTRTAKRLMILAGSSNVGRTLLTGMRSAENGLDSSSKAGPLSIFA